MLSTILFICVFQLLLDFLKPLRKKHGFRFKQTATRILAEAYADDLAQVTKDCKYAATRRINGSSGRRPCEPKL